MKSAAKRKPRAKAKPKAKTRAKAKPATKRAAEPNLDSMTLKELLELEKRVQKAIHDAQLRERTSVLKKMKEIADESGFNLDELVGGPRKGRGKGKAKTTSVAKFQNPDNPTETWTGRGRKPNWLVSRLKKGATMEQFAI
ncbi:MAG: H-NS family nucleoid-associated regulatory protein [Hyphomicrobiaceae bacterium]